jgi:cytochrome c oxidase accessory protein FixG
MEFIYRDLEFLIEGTPAQQKKLSAQVWNTEKIIKRGGKNFLFYLIAFGISNVFLSYIIGSDQLLKIITDDPTNHIAGLSTMLIFSAVFYFVFAFFREQVCSLVCPYGRLQGVLLDSNTIVVAYDYKRGEPRGPYRANENRAEATKGDCISCTRCVQVCPTGIDVRNGTQLECINCSACIDECDSVMTSIGKPKGLIRYDSENGIAAGSKLKITPRNLAYTVVLGVLITVFLTLLLTKSDIDAVILRTYNTIYQEQPNGRYSNMYNYKIFNKSNQDLPVDLKLLSHKGEIQLVGNNKLLIPKQDFREGVIFVILDKESVKPEVDIVIGVYSQGKLIEKSKLTFLGPK